MRLIERNENGNANLSNMRLPHDSSVIHPSLLSSLAQSGVRKNGVCLPRPTSFSCRLTAKIYPMPFWKRWLPLCRLSVHQLGRCPRCSMKVSMPSSFPSVILRHSPKPSCDAHRLPNCARPWELTTGKQSQHSTSSKPLPDGLMTSTARRINSKCASSQVSNTNNLPYLYACKHTYNYTIFTYK